MLLYYHSWMFYNHFIVISYHFLVLTYWHSAKCQLLFFACFLHRRKSISDGVQMPRKFMEIFYGPEGRYRALVAPGGSPEEGKTHQGAPGGPGAPWWVVPTSGAPRTASLLYKYHNSPETSEWAMKYSSNRRRVQNHQIQSRHHLGWGSPPPLVPLRWCVNSSLYISGP